MAVMAWETDQQVRRHTVIAEDPTPAPSNPWLRSNCNSGSKSPTPSTSKNMCTQHAHIPQHINIIQNDKNNSSKSVTELAMQVSGGVLT